MMRYLLCVLIFAYVSPIYAEQVVLPIGTQVYLEPGELITSKRGESNPGEIVPAQVWRNVVVDGYVVIKAGAPAIARISDIKRRNIAGKKGQLKVAAISARGVDGQDILLDGGYNEEGKSRVALSVSLFLLVAWPLIFIPGKNATLGPGNIFDGEVQEDTWVDVSGAKPEIKSETPEVAGLTADVMYDAIDPEKKLKNLPIQMIQCGSEVSNPRVVTVNGGPVKGAIELQVMKSVRKSDCTTAEAQLTFKKLLKQFQPGINRFDIESNGQTAEIILQAEV